ncbi:MAG: hypothetical protein NTV30_06200, partial [Chloroflexi bacterium]|nr:hypothetical protein [Chloroflexota bacterium]
VEKVLIEQFNIVPDKARILASFSNGLIGWAIFASKDEDIVVERSGYIDNLVGLITTTLNKRFEFAARYAVLFGKDRDSVYQILDLGISLWRDLLLIKANTIDVIVNIDRVEELKNIADKLTAKEILDFIKNIDNACRQLEQNVNSRLVLEVLMLKMPSLVVKDQVRVRM